MLSKKKHIPRAPSHTHTHTLQLLKIESAGTGAEKALLADVKAKNADATVTELLRLYRVRRRRALPCICRALQRMCWPLYLRHIAPTEALAAVLRSPGLGHRRGAFTQARSCIVRSTAAGGSGLTLFAWHTPHSQAQRTPLSMHALRGLRDAR